jgi:hypothetical protein
MINEREWDRSYYTENFKIHRGLGIRYRTLCPRVQDYVWIFLITYQNLHLYQRKPYASVNIITSTPSLYPMLSYNTSAAFILMITLLLKITECVLQVIPT